MKINVETIEHSEQEYETCGDYWMDGDTMEVRVSDMGNADYEFLVAIHEQIEAYFCMKENVDFDKITKFDKHFEAMRRDYSDLVGDMEPGDSEVAPYNKQHKMASMFEKWLADNIAKIEDKNPDVYWQEYDEAVNKLSNGKD